MIARYIIFFLLLILLPDIYIYHFYLQGKCNGRWKIRLFLLATTLFVSAYTAYLYFQPDFQPANPAVLEVYLWILGLFVVPKAVLALCSFAGSVVKRVLRLRCNYGNPLGLILVLLCVYITVYGFTKGMSRIEVNRVSLPFEDLPASYDGYKIVLFSDLHVGSYTAGRQKILENVVDSIRAQNADLIVFAGDLQNLRPQEIYKHRKLLASLRATDGVVSVMGNHDYTLYIRSDSITDRANIQEMERLQHQMGWQLLRNEHIVLRRAGSDSIVVAGLDDDGERAEYKRADIGKALEGVEGSPFTIMVEHEPPCWRDMILPQSHAQLTLSGHTHGGQITLLGFTPLSWKRREIRGLYSQDERHLYVTSGVGGLIPLRYEVSPEIVVIELRKKY